MLREYNPAPDFILPDKATGGQLALADILGANWIGMALAPIAGVSEKTQAFLEIAAARAAELQARKLQIVAIAAEEVALKVVGTAESIHILTDATGTVAKQYDGCVDDGCFYLVNPKGVIEMARMDLPDLDDIFAAVDRLSAKDSEAAQPSLAI